MEAPPDLQLSPSRNDVTGASNIYMLDESRAYYQDEKPPFVIKSGFRPGPNDRADGTRPVILVLEELQGLFGSRVTAPSSILTITPWSRDHAFWTLDLGAMKIIVKPTGQGYWPWLGPTSQFSLKKVARSEVTTTDSALWNFQKLEKKSPLSLPGAAYATPNDEMDDSTLDENAVTVTGAGRGHSHQPRNPLHGWKDASPYGTVSQKRTRIVSSSDNDEDYVPSRREPVKKARPPPENRPKRDSNSNYFIPPVGPQPSKPEGRKTPSTTFAPPKASPQPFPLSTSRLTPEQLSNTTLHISRSSNNYGAIPVPLQTCSTKESFFRTVLGAWELGEEQAKGSVLSVMFKWLPEEEPMVVTKIVPSSFDSMLDVIEEAPCWQTEGKKKCDVKVKIITG